MASHEPYEVIEELGRIWARVCGEPPPLGRREEQLRDEGLNQLLRRLHYPARELFWSEPAESVSMGLEWSLKNGLKFDPDRGSFFGWCKWQMKKAVLNESRKHSTVKRTGGSNVSLARLEQELGDAEWEEKVRILLAGLSRRQQRIVRLKEAGYTQVQIASIVKVSERTVRSEQKKVEQVLQERGYGP